MTGDPYLDNWRWRRPAELAGLKVPGLPATKRGINALIAKRDLAAARDSAGRLLSRRANGGGREYHEWAFGFCREAVAFFVKQGAVQEGDAPRETSGRRSDRVDWAWYERLPDDAKAKAEWRKSIVKTVDLLNRGGLTATEAVKITARENGIGKSSINEWRRFVRGYDEADWLPQLADRYAGKVISAECDPRAWEFIKADYLRLSRPSFESCYQRLLLAAGEHGWTVPSSRTLYRRIENEIPKPVVVLLRQGAEALKRMYPAQERDRTMFHALEAVNADGHKWDVFVRWPDGQVGRPMMVAIQDLYSNKILGWRVDRSENADAVRLVVGDVFRRYGIFDGIWLDNGRGFASKWITGGTPNRYRFKVKPEEPAGILTALGVEVHWTRPYSGQSKPIERAFRDLCDAIAKHPAFEGAYTGNKPDAKPENYGSKAVPIETFLQVVGEGIRQHNARPKRNTRVCARQLSFDQAFEQSYAKAVIRKAGPEQLRLCLLAAENVRADRESGALRLLGNRYWAEILHGHRGEPLTLRFDPDALHDGVHAYRLDGSYVGFAECLEAAGFADTQAARDHARKFGAFKRATREAARLETQLSLDALLRLLPAVDEVEPPATKVVRMVNGPAVTLPAPAENALSAADYEEAFSRGLSLIQGGRDDI